MLFADSCTERRVHRRLDQSRSHQRSCLSARPPIRPLLTQSWVKSDSSITTLVEIVACKTSPQVYVRTTKSLVYVARWKLLLERRRKVIIIQSENCLVRFSDLHICRSHSLSKKELLATADMRPIARLTQLKCITNFKGELECHGRTISLENLHMTYKKRPPVTDTPLTQPCSRINIIYSHYGQVLSSP